MAVKLDTLDFDQIAKAEQRRGKGSWLIMGGAFLMSAIWIVPFYYMIISIFKTTPEYAQKHPMLIFSGTVFPFQMYLIPLFFTYQELGLLNTHLGMLIFYTAICIPFPVLVLRAIHVDLERSAVLHCVGEQDRGALNHGCFAGVSRQLFVVRAECHYDGCGHCLDSVADFVYIPAQALHGWHEDIEYWVKRRFQLSARPIRS